jgi:hypothetical protein
MFIDLYDLYQARKLQMEARRKPLSTGEKIRRACLKCLGACLFGLCVGFVIYVAILIGEL